MAWDRDLGVNLKQARIGVFLTQKGLAEKMRVDQTTVSAWERGRQEPPPEAKNRLAEILGMPRKELDGQGIVSSGELHGRLGRAEALAEEEWNVPEIGTVGASQGRVGAVTVDAAALARIKRRFKLRVMDSSMEEVAREGQWVIVDTRADIRPGDLVVVDLSGEGEEEALYFKKFELVNGQYEFHSVNREAKIQPLVRALPPRRWWCVVSVLLRG